MEQQTSPLPTLELPELPAWLDTLTDLAIGGMIPMVLTVVLLGIVCGDLLRPF
jgi:hypothetical protein